MSVVGGVALFWAANFIAAGVIFIIGVVIDFIHEHTKAYKNSLRTTALSESTQTNATASQDPVGPKG